jgi:hypothetical protein
LPDTHETGNIAAGGYLQDQILHDEKSKRALARGFVGFNINLLLRIAG